MFSAEEEELVTQDPEESQQERVYSEYLARIEQGRLTTEAIFDFGISFLVTVTANSANNALILICIDFGMNWLSATIFGLGLGLIPAAIHVNNAGIDFNTDYKVKKISSLLLAGVSVVGAFSVSYSSGGEKRTLIDYTNTGITEASKEISNYEIKVSPWQGVNFLFSYHGLEAVGNTMLPVMVLAVVWKWLSSRR